MKNHSLFRAHFCAQLRHLAFSLVEMLMALLVASVLLAALAPVMTRKFNENISVSGSNGGGMDGSPETLTCYSYTDTNPAWNITLNKVYYANFVIASGGGGGAGASIENTSDKKETIQGSSSATSSAIYSEKTIPITDAMTNVKITNLVGGGGGGGKGNSAKSEDGAWAPTKQSDCEPFGVYISAANNGGKDICVSKYNPGEGRTGSPSIPSSVTIVPADKNTSCSSKNTNCCWYGNNGNTYKTAGTCDTSANGINYSGCHRTVCNWSAANTICANWKPKGSSGPTGRLPSYAELTAWKNSGLVNDNKTSKTPGTLNWNGTAGLQLCNHTTGSSTGAPRCIFTGTCRGAAPSTSYSNTCYPRHIWSGTPSGNSYWDAWLADGKMTIRTGAPFPSTLAFGVRCVIEGATKTITYKSLSGGSGGSGAYAKDIDISEYIREAQKTGGGKIVLKAGHGGKGGSSAVSGSNSYVEVYDNNNKKIYGIAAYGGGRGTDASTTSSGSYGSGGKCYKYDANTLNWAAIACTGSNGYSGSSGSSNTYTTYGTARTAPRGANSVYNGSGGGAGGTTSHTSGYSASSYGAGGGAGTGMYTSETSYSDGSGGSGSGGFAEITYQEKYSAAGGGGGGAGSVAYIKNINVGANTTCSLVTGKGGEGGQKGIKGANGGDSYVKCLNTPEYRVNGGKGGNLGKSASASIANPEGGKKGDAGLVNDDVLNKVPPENRVIKTGTNGTDGKGKGTGGKGGTSGTGTKGGCGGLYKETGVCEVPEILDMASLEGQGFTYNHIITPTYANLTSGNPSFGTAGAGGGGGAWNKQLGSGAGGNGMPGYVCVYWKKNE